MSIERILTLSVLLLYVAAATLGFTVFGLVGENWGVGETFMAMMPWFVVNGPRLLLIFFL